MICPVCKHPKSAVIKTDPYDTVKLRVRSCLKCGHVWRTEETYSEPAKKTTPVA